jgi:hypothetical protein
VTGAFLDEVAATSDYIKVNHMIILSPHSTNVRSTLNALVNFLILTLNIPSGVPLGPYTVIFCDPVVIITTDVLLIFVCVPHQLKINIM